MLNRIESFIEKKVGEYPQSRRVTGRRGFLKGAIVFSGILGTQSLTGCSLFGGGDSGRPTAGPTSTSVSKPDAQATVDAKILDSLNRIDEHLKGLEAKGTATPRPEATVGPTGTATPKPEATVGPTGTATPKPEATVAVKGILVPADRSGNGWILQHPDGNRTEVKTLPEGFTPDRALCFATDIRALEIGVDLNPYKDWEKALNTKRAGGALAGYNYNYDDFCPTPDFKCNVQADMFAWRTFQGMEVAVPGIGRLTGGPRRSVVLNVLNLDDSVHAWDNDGFGQVEVKRGFTATGRIFDGEKSVDVLERNLSGHWAFRQFSGTPEKSYVGITDSPDNALEVLMVSVQRKQWGLNTDGSKRMEFQLIRAELIGRGKK